MDSCVGCKWYLGAGNCSINMEKECGDGEFELYERKDEEKVLYGFLSGNPQESLFCIENRP